MATPRFFVFTPVPLRARCDGWDPSFQLRFIQLLAAGAKPGEAAAALGKNRQNAYALRNRPGAASFAAAWDAAAAEGRKVRVSERIRPPRRTRPWVPHGPLVDAAVARGEREIAAAASDEEARVALGRMLDGIYGPKGSNSDKSDKVAPGLSAPGGPNFSPDSRGTVAFRSGSLRRRPC